MGISMDTMYIHRNGHAWYIHGYTMYINTVYTWYIHHNPWIYMDIHGISFDVYTWYIYGISIDDIPGYS
jgi:hypothetical protein